MGDADRIKYLWQYILFNVNNSNDLCSTFHTKIAAQSAFILKFIKRSLSALGAAERCKPHGNYLSRLVQTERIQAHV